MKPRFERHNKEGFEPSNESTERSGNSFGLFPQAFLRATGWYSIQQRGFRPGRMLNLKLKLV